MINNFEEIFNTARQSIIGKHLPNNLYVHISTLTYLDNILQKYEEEGRKLVNNINDFTLVKFNLEEAKISYLYYPDFDSNPHPPLVKSIVVNIVEKTSKIIHYNQSNNPPILHRKETFVRVEYPDYFK